MSFDAQRLLELLPAIYRLRDAEVAGELPARLTASEEAELGALEALGDGATPAERRRREALRARRDRGPLTALLAVLAEQVAVLEEDLDQLYDDQFVETCAPWAVPYIGDLIGYRTLHGRASGAGSRRAEVAHTIAFRRRKGTASMLEQLARDVTGWNARVVEFFLGLATTQYMNHLRPANRVTPDLRDGDALEWVGSAFDALPRTLDVRRIAARRGRYNVPNVGIFLWRLDAHRLLRSPAVPEAADATGRRFRVSPLGIDAALATRPEREPEITHLAEPVNVPTLVTRRMLHRHTARYYGPRRSLELFVDGDPVPLAEIAVCHLADHGAGWAHEAPAGRIAIDPVLGRVAVAPDRPAPSSLEVTHHYLATGATGGGDYPRLASFESPSGGFQRVPQDHATVQDAITALGGGGVVEIRDDGIYREAIAVDVAAQGCIELRAADGCRPTLLLGAPMSIRGGAGAAFVLNGVQVGGEAIEVPADANGLRRLRIAHATLVPGRTLDTDGRPLQAGAASVRVEADDVELAIERCVLGGLRLAEGSVATLTDCVVDAHAKETVAIAAPTLAVAPGGALTLEACTVVGETRTIRLDVSNSILLGHVEVERRQEGCARFSYLPPGSVAPRRHRCQPGEGPAARNVPSFTTLRFGVPGYAQLGERTPPAIARGADDESEMGAGHFLYQPQRESDLATRLDEYLRIGLEAGVFHET